MPAVSLYCWTTLMPFYKNELALLREHLARPTFFAGCAESVALSNISIPASELLPLASKAERHSFRGAVASADFPIRWMYSPSLRASATRAAWLAVFRLGHYAKHDWTVKFDLDGVFLPSRLIDFLGARTPPPAPAYLDTRPAAATRDNRKIVRRTRAIDALGPLVVLSAGGFRAYNAFARSCEDEASSASSGSSRAPSSGWFFDCLDSIGVTRIDAHHLLQDLPKRTPTMEERRPVDADPAACSKARVRAGGLAMLHPFRSIFGWRDCWRNAAGRIGRRRISWRKPLS